MANTRMMKESFFKDANDSITLDYRSVLRSISDFRRSNGKSSQIAFDAPQTYYFKIFFYFDNDAEKGPASSLAGLPTSNLLGLTYDGSIISGFPWEGKSVSMPDAMPRITEGYYPTNTALNYLLINYEWDRARKLTEFIKLLSEISYKYPWYFSTISGLENAVTRKELVEDEFKLEEQRRSIDIKCLPDAEDNKIGRLLDLYRNIVYSHSMHRYVLPANLRKFDMGVFIFSRPIKNLHRSVGKNDIITHPEGNKWDVPQTTKGNYASFKPNLDYAHNNTTYQTSYKYIELHNCEIDYNSSASGYNELNNKDGFNQEYTIKIYYDDAVENRYDEWTMRNIGDYTLWDANLNTSNINGNEDAFWNLFFDNQLNMESFQETELMSRINLLKSKGDTSKTVSDKDNSTGNELKNTETVGTFLKDLVKKGDHGLTEENFPGESQRTASIGSSFNTDGRLWIPKNANMNNGMLVNAYNQLSNYAYKKYIKPIKKMALGNFYMAQFKKVKSLAKSIERGDVFGSIKKGKNLIGSFKSKEDWNVKNQFNKETSKLMNGWKKKS